MGKITELPFAETLSGLELAPVVQDGEARKVRLSDVFAPANSAVEQAQAARDIAIAAAGVDYPSLAAALSLAQEGEKFTYWDGEELVFAKKDDGQIVPFPGPWIGSSKIALLQGGAVQDAISYWTPKMFGAIADGTLHTVAEWIIPGALGRYVNLAALQVDYPHVTATTQSIDWAAAQKAVNTAHDVGGGLVRLLAGHYVAKEPLAVKTGVDVRGDGMGCTLWENVATVGFSKCGIITGNVGDITGGNGLWAETTYNIQAITPGDFKVNLVTPGDGAQFIVGDIVGVGSYEKWTQPFPDNFEKQLNLNVVEAVNGGEITLRYAIPDTYSAVAGNPTIRRVTGTFNGYDGKPMWCARDCSVTDLEIRQATGLFSGWYAIFPCGVNQHWENIRMDKVSSLVGSNMLSHSTVRNLRGTFEAGLLDFADWQNNNLIEDIHGTRVAANPYLNRIGISIYCGSDIIARRIYASLGGYGGLSLYKVPRSVYEDVQVINAGADYGILLGYGGNCTAVRCEVIGQAKYGIGIVGERHRVTESKVPVTPVGYHSVVAPSTINVCYVHDNEFGIEGSFTPRDRFMQLSAQSPNAQVYNNTGYVECEARKGGVNWAGFASTSATSFTAIKTASLKGTTGVVRGYWIFAAGARGGSASTKTARLRIGGTTLAQVNYLAADAGTWELSAVLNVRPSTNAVHASGRAMMGATVQANNMAVIADGLLNDTTISVEAVVANPADSIVIYQFIVVPIIEQLQ